MKKLLLIVAILALASSAQAAPVLIGAPATSGNCFPFGCGPGGTHYQQVYAASNFSGTITITGVTFFDTRVVGGSFWEADYVLSLSTTSKAVNGLDTNMANNIGVDNTLLFSGHLAGLFGSSFTLGGSGVFTYNPLNGNLLMDITRANMVDGREGYLDARSGDAGGLFSRMYDYGSGTSDYGLVTQFETGNRVPDVGSSLLLLGMGLAGLRAFRRR